MRESYWQSAWPLRLPPRSLSRLSVLPGTGSAPDIAPCARHGRLARLVRRLRLLARAARAAAVASFCLRKLLTARNPVHTFGNPRRGLARAARGPRRLSLAAADAGRAKCDSPHDIALDLACSRRSRACGSLVSCRRTQTSLHTNRSRRTPTRCQRAPLHLTSSPPEGKPGKSRGRKAS